MTKPIIAFLIVSTLIITSHTQLSFNKSNNEMNSSTDDCRDLSGNEPFLIDTTSVACIADGDQGDVKVSFDGTNFFAVWHENRNGSDMNVAGARINEMGMVLDASIHISMEAGDQQVPCLAFGDSIYMVAWQDNRNGSWDIYGTRINSDGQILDQDPLEIMVSNSDHERPAIAFDGRNFLVVWQDNSQGSWDIYGVRLNGSGEILDQFPFPLVNRIEDQDWPDLAFNGENYLLVWKDEGDESTRGTWAARIDTSGTVLDPSGIEISLWNWSGCDLSVSSDQANYLVVWGDEDSGSHDLYGARISSQGEIMDPQEIVVSNINGNQLGPSISFDGTNYMVIWTDERYDSYDIYATMIDQHGCVSDQNGIMVSDFELDQWRPSICFGNNTHLGCWIDNRNGQADIYGSRIDCQGNALDSEGIPIALSSNSELDPTACFDGINLLVVWEDNRNNSWDIYGHRVGLDQSILDSEPIPIGLSPSHLYQPSIAFDGTNYLVVWNNENDLDPGIFGTLVDQNGIVMDPTGINISPGSSTAWNPEVIFGATDYLVCWQEPLRLVATRVDQSGTVLDIDEILISESYCCVDPANPALAFNGSEYLVVYDYQHYACRPSSRILGTLISQHGQIIDPGEFTISFGDWPIWNVHPAVAFDGESFLVVWNDASNSAEGGGDIRGTRLNFNGEVVDTVSILISTDPGCQINPTVSFDGENYIVIWEERNDGVDNKIQGAKISSQGAILESFPVSSSPFDESSPTVVSFDQSHSMVFYSSWTDSYGDQLIDSNRIWGNSLRFFDVQLDWFGAEVILTWPQWPGASEYWIYGTPNQQYFYPGIAPDYEFRLDVLSSDITTWSSPNGIGNPNENWTYVVIAVDAAEQELARSGRVGEFDHSMIIGP